jgi:hypothetical protein
VTPPIPAFILLIGNDSALTYLLERYAQRSGYGLRSLQTIPPLLDVCALRPAAVWYPSLEILEAFQPLNAALTNCDIPLVVCLPVADEVRARELGADHCVHHPMTYPDFVAALSAVGVAGVERRSQALKDGNGDVLPVAP